MQNILNIKHIPRSNLLLFMKFVFFVYLFLHSNKKVPIGVGVFLKQRSRIGDFFGEK